MHALELRETRFRLEKALAKLGEDSDTEAIEQQIADLQAVCEHGHFDEDPAKGWRCRDCGLTRDPEPLPDTDQQSVDPASATAG